MPLSNLQQRAITGVIGIAILLALIMIGEYTFILLVVGLSLGSLYEFFGLIEKNTKGKPNRLIGYFFTFFSVQIFFLTEKSLLPTVWYFSLIPIIPIVFIMELYRKTTEPFLNISYTLLGIIYSVIPFLFFIKIAFINQHMYLSQIVLGIFIILWVSDTGAYISGKTFGKHKLFPSVSPGKTWEGAIGGGVLSLAIAFLLSKYWGPFSLTEWLGTAIIIVVFGMFGDLVESRFKRSINIKDSGNLLPGHGGMLDRFDGLYLSLPVLYSFLIFFH